MRKNWKRRIVYGLGTGLVVVQLAACAKPALQTGESAASQTEAGNQTASEQKEGWDEALAVKIQCEDGKITVDGAGATAEGQVVTINQAGTYMVEGELTDGQIRIDVNEGETVRLVLNGVELSNKSTAPIYSSGKGSLILTLEDGSKNVVSDGEVYQFEEGEDEPNAPVFAKGDLTIDGAGELTVTGNYECAIRSKGVLTVSSGVLNLEAKTDGLKGKSGVVIEDGSLAIQAGKDGIKANEDQDPELGYIYIKGGDITISADDDGIQAETALVVDSGEITITKSQEGLAGKTVDINGGVIKIMSEDDGINSAATVETEREKEENQEGVYTRITGGEVWINAMADGIDSNGNFYMEGGTVYISGSQGGADGALDYNGTGTVSGGTIVAAGSGGMSQSFDTDSTQNFLVINYTEAQKGGTMIRVQDSAGEELLSYTPEKDFSVAVISSGELESGKSFQVVTGEDTVELQVEGTMTVYGTSTGGMRGGGGGNRMAPGGQMPSDGQTPPDGELPPDGQQPSGGKGRGGGRERPGRPDQEQQTGEQTDTAREE